MSIPIASSPVAGPLRVRLVLAVAFAASAFVASVVEAAEPASLLNVVVVMVDDLGWMDLSCQGSQFYQTPHIDRLAARGVRFTNGYAACAVCSPTRAAYLTGRYPARLGITDWIRATWQRAGRRLSPADPPNGYEASSKRPLLCPLNPFWMEHEEVTLAEELRAAGYVTGHIGKWHLGDRRWHPETQGFVENIGGCDYGHPPSYFDPFERQDKQGRVWRIPTLISGEPGTYLTDREADEAIDFIQRHRAEPFFLSLCHYAVHTPIQAKQNLIERYQAAVDKTAPQRNAVYAAMIHSVDEAMGKLLETLDELELFERTILVFTSDNGGLYRVTSNYPLRAGKGTPFEGGIRVPWIMHFPQATTPGSISDVPIITCDLKPTILGALGIESTDPQTVDGVSLVDVLRSPKAEGPGRSLYWHFPHYRHAWGPYAIVRSGSYKLIRWFEDDGVELYDLSEDLGEQHDLAERVPEIAANLEAELRQWLISVGAQLPQHNPAHGT